MRVTLTGASGLIGTNLVRALSARGDDVTVLSRDPERASDTLGVAAEAWQPTAGPAPPRRSRAATRSCTSRASASTSAGATAPGRRSARRASSARATSSTACAAPSRAPTCSSPRRPSATTGRTATRSSTSRPRGGDGDFLGGCAPPGSTRPSAPRSSACASSASAPASCSTATAARSPGCSRRSARGVGGPVAGGDQYMPWIHVDDLVGIYLAAIDGAHWSGPVNATRARAGDQPRLLARARPRPAPARRCCRSPARRCDCSTATWPRSSPRASARCRDAPLELGYAFRHADLDEALRDALAS